jgi:ATP-dependent RNA helicase DeaD
MLFSATIARGIAMQAKYYQRDAVRIDTTSQTEPHGDIDYRAMRISPGDTERAVVNVLRYFEAGGALVFCATREAVRHLHASLRERGFHAVGLSGEMNQRERNDALQSLRDGHARVCVATDVAARGLDLPDLGLVIHADLPTNKATLLHRSGRTGRAGRKGTSVLLVTHTKRRRTEQVLQSANINATWSGPPTAEEIRAQDRQRLLEHPALTAVTSDEDAALARQLAEKLPAEQLASALIGLLRAELPDPEDVNDDVRMRDTASRDTQPMAPRERTPRMPRTREERGFTNAEGEGAWFHLNVGRRRNADPKWLVPLICRLGHVTKAEIGPIRIFDEETRFEIVGHAAEAFTVAAQATLEDNIRITPSSPPPQDERSSAPRPRHEREPRVARDHREPREARPPREHREARPPRENREARPPRENREPRPPRDFPPAAAPQADAPPPRDENRNARNEQRAKEQAHIKADPVFASLAETPRPALQPAPDATSGMNRKQRRDAQRAAGVLPVLAPTGDQPPKRSWSPDDSAPQPEKRIDRSTRETRHADVRHAERRERAPQGDKPSGFKPRGFKPRDFKPGGPKPAGGKPYRAKSDGRSGGGKPGGGKAKGNWRAK